ncbi:MAG: cytochrome P450 [Rhodobacteraceae bacterium]|nr:cytochrome P450 [Paracoccaceae bacterium]
MQRLSQSPRDPDFVADPYPFYDRARRSGPVIWWEDYGMPALVSHAAVIAALKDRRLARVPPDGLPPFPNTLADFGRVESLSLLSLDGPAHTRLRGQVLRDFTSRRIAGLGPEIERLCHRLIDAFPADPFDLIPAYCAPIPVIVIARLLGVPDTASDRLLAWSHAMVAMYRPGVAPTEADAANSAAAEFHAWLSDEAEARDPRGTDLLSALRAAEQDGVLSRDETIATAILLLNAGHEATVHALGLSIARLISTGAGFRLTRPDQVSDTVEECLRIDAPLHLFTRHVHAETEIGDVRFQPGAQLACLLGAANRDPAAFPDPGAFRPGRAGVPLTSFGAGVHFCLGAPLARLEMQIALRVLFARCPDIRLAAEPRIADIYHFRGYQALPVAV